MFNYEKIRFKKSDAVMIAKIYKGELLSARSMWGRGWLWSIHFTIIC